jgi:hypothetical protein
VAFLYTLPAQAGLGDFVITRELTQFALRGPVGGFTGTIAGAYAQWGVKGVKFGFVNVGSQYWTAWLHEAIRKASAHKLMVDIPALGAVRSKNPTPIWRGRIVTTQRTILPLMDASEKDLLEDLTPPDKILT